MLGTTIGMTGFFISYFWVLNNPLNTPTVMPLIAADHWIPFQPSAFLLYISLWFYVSLAPAFLISRRELISYGLAASVISVIGLGIFLIWPTTVTPAEIDWSLYPSLSFLKEVDASGNACPSLHVAFAVFTAIWFQRILKQMQVAISWHGLNWLWCLGILYSTVAVRQHVLLDVFAGIILGGGAGLAHLYLLGRKTR